MPFIREEAKKKALSKTLLFSQCTNFLMPKPPKRREHAPRNRKERAERFLRRLGPELQQAEMESKARDLARKELLPSFFKWTRKRMSVEIKHHALTGKKGNKVKAPVRAASLFREKQQLAQSIARHFEIVYMKRTQWSPSERLAFLAEMKAGLLEDVVSLFDANI